jgi:hypothetical protein
MRRLPHQEAPRKNGRGRAGQEPTDERGPRGGWPLPRSRRGRLEILDHLLQPTEVGLQLRDAAPGGRGALPDLLQFPLRNLLHLEPLESPGQPCRGEVSVDSDRRGDHVGQRCATPLIAQHQGVGPGSNLGDDEPDACGDDVRHVAPGFPIERDLTHHDRPGIAERPPTRLLRLAHRLVDGREVEALEQIGVEVPGQTGSLRGFSAPERDVSLNLDRLSHRQLGALRFYGGPPSPRCCPPLHEDRRDQDDRANNAQPAHDASSMTGSGEEDGRTSGSVQPDQPEPTPDAPRLFSGDMRTKAGTRQLLWRIMSVGVLVPLVMPATGCGPSRTASSPQASQVRRPIPSSPVAEPTATPPERCAAPDVRPTYLPWLKPGEKIPRPTESYDEEIDRAQLTWGDPDAEAGVGLTVYPLPRWSGAGDIGIELYGVKGRLHALDEGGLVGINWDIPGRCNFVELNLYAPGLSIGKAVVQLMMIARSLR